MMMVHEIFDRTKQPLGDQVLFANPCKTSNDISVGRSLKVPWVTADSTEELLKLATAGYKPNVLLRIAVDDTGSSCPFSEKFGLPQTQIESCIREADALRIPITGLSFHVGSGSTNLHAFKEAIYQAKDLWSDLQVKGLVGTMHCLDIGGGWSPDEAIFKEQTRLASIGLNYGLRPARTIAEPGRFFAAPCYDLYVRVVGKKPRSGGGWRYTLDESIYGQFSCIPFDHATPKIARVRTSATEAPRRQTPAILFGRTCDSLDWIANAQSMDELEVGDWLYIPQMGAYTAATSTEFNGFPKPPVCETFDVPEERELDWQQTLTFPLANMLSVSQASEEGRRTE
jgi:ornithine decarboxylase